MRFSEHEMPTSLCLPYYKIGNIVLSRREYEKVRIFPQVLLHNNDNEDHFLQDVGGRKIWTDFSPDKTLLNQKTKTRAHVFPSIPE